MYTAMLCLAQSTKKTQNLSSGESDPVPTVFSACFQHQHIDCAVISQNTETGKRSIRSSKSIPGVGLGLLGETVT